MLRGKILFIDIISPSFVDENVKALGKYSRNSKG
jgi:hypothetical protein